METHEIVIEYADPDKFKAGMNETQEQIWHIASQIKELIEYRDRMVSMYESAIQCYCDPDHEYTMSKMSIPKRFAKVD